MSDVEFHLGAGVSLAGPFVNRPDDAAGFMVSHVQLSDEPGAGYAEDETTLELFYRWQLTPFASVTPDLQYVFNPNGQSGQEDALVGSLRVVVVF